MDKFRLYLGNKMVGLPYFNTPWFDQATEALLALPFVGEVFNPAQRDRERGFDPMLCPAGSAEESVAAGFNRREALREDWEWIARYSDGMIVGPDWQDSLGTISEVGCHQGLRLPVWTFNNFMLNWEHPNLIELTIPTLQSILEL